MSKLLKVCLGALGLLLVIAIVGVISLVTLVNPNRYKAQITQQIYKTTGRQATIGNIGWSVFPWIKLQLDNVIINNPTGFPSTPFVAVGQAGVSVSLPALLKREVIIDKVSLNDVQINLIRTLNDSNNWTMPSSSKNTATSNSSPASTTSNESSIKSFAINSIAISNTTVNWQDATKNQTISFKINSLNTKDINYNGTPFTVNADFLYQANQIPQPITLKIAATVNANKATQQCSISDLELNLNQFTITGNVQLNQSANPSLKAELSIPNGNLAALLNQLGYPVNFQNKAALTDVGANFTVLESKNSAQVTNLTMSVDGAKITGQVNLSQLNPLHGNYTLAIDKLNLDQYQSAATDTNPANKDVMANSTTNSMPATVPAPSSNKSIMPAYLQAANIAGKLTIGTLQVSNMQLQQVIVPVSLQKGVIIATPITAQLYQGTLQADLKANYTAATPEYSLSAALKDVDVNALLQQAANFNKLTGTGQINFLVNTTGNDKNSMLQALNGNGHIQLQQGSFAGMDLMSAINSAASLFLKQAPVASTEPAQTNFTEFNASFQINNGLVANNDLALTSPVMNVSGNGTVSLVTQLIDYNLSVTPQGNIIPQLASLEKAIGGSIPVKVKGTISNPQVSPDMQKISMAATKQTIDQNLNEISKGVDKFSKGVAKSLSGMFGN